MEKVNYVTAKATSWKTVDLNPSIYNTIFRQLHVNFIMPSQCVSPSFKNYFAYCIMVYIIAIIQIVLFYGSDVFVHVCVYCVCEYVCAVYMNI